MALSEVVGLELDLQGRGQGLDKCIHSTDILSAYYVSVTVRFRRGIDIERENEVEALRKEYT